MKTLALLLALSVNVYSQTWLEQNLLTDTELVPVEGEALPEWELNKPLEKSNNI